MQRNQQQIDQDYRQECVQLGHKVHLLDRLPREIEEHKMKLASLSEEMEMLQNQPKNPGEPHEKTNG